MVALRYPPALGAGNIRTLKNQKYLPLYGWIGDTLTGPLPDGGGPALATEHAQEGPGATWRVRFPDPPRAAAGLLMRSPRQPAPWVRRFAADSLRRFARYAMAPDGQVLFAPAVFLRTASVAARYDVVYATGMPWSGLLAATGLHLRWRTPLVLDLRDPWIEPDGVRYGRLRNRVESHLEGFALRRAAAVVVTAEGLRADLLRRRPWMERKIHVIPNGYDEEDFASSVVPPTTRFDVVHTGHFYGTKGPSDLFEGIRFWLGSRPELRPSVRVRLVGPERPMDREAAVRSGLDQITQFEGVVPHAEAVTRLRSCRVAVAVDYGPEEASMRVLSKIFEYMRSGRPILLLSSGGNTENILRPCPRARIVSRDNPAAVASALDEIASAPGLPEDFRPEEYVLQFERRALAQRLAGILDSVARPADRDP